MDAKHIKGLRVIDLADGVTLGTIDQIFLDPGTKRIVSFGLSADPEGLDRSQPRQVIAADAVRTLGADALTVASPPTGAVRSTPTSDRPTTLVEIDDLIKRQVMTESGTLLGEVAAAQVVPETLQLARIEVSPGFFKGNRWFPAERITRLGGDVVVVAEAVAASADEAAAPPTGEPLGMTAP